MTRLPTLGGTHGFATGTNNFGQTVGWAENTVHDSTCIPPQQLQFRAVVWGPGSNQKRQLRPLPGTDDTSPPRPRSTTPARSSASRASATRPWAASARSTRPLGHGSRGRSNRRLRRRRLEHADGDQPARRRGRVRERLGGGRRPTSTAGLPLDESQGIATSAPWPATHEPGDGNQRVAAGRRPVLRRRRNCRGFLWQNGVMTDLNELVVGGYDDVITTATTSTTWAASRARRSTRTRAGSSPSSRSRSSTDPTAVGRSGSLHSGRRLPGEALLRDRILVGDPQVCRGQRAPRPPALGEVVERAGRMRRVPGKGSSEAEVGGRACVRLAEPKGQIVSGPGAEAVEGGDRGDEPVEPDAAIESHGVRGDRAGEEADCACPSRCEPEPAEVGCRRAWPPRETCASARAARARAPRCRAAARAVRRSRSRGRASPAAR